MAKKRMTYLDYIWISLRLGMAWLFIWPFFDKLLGLGFTTKAENAWIAGGSPTYGFLAIAAKGPFAPLYNKMAGCVALDWVFMIGLICIGLALLFGVGRKISGYSGALLVFLMWTAVLPPEHNPFLDDHIIYPLILILLAHVKTKFSLTDWWSKQKIVKKYKWLE